MPRYSTSTSIYVILPGLPNTTTNTTLIQQHADRVSGLIGSYVGRWYTVSGWTTAASTPQEVQECSDGLTAQRTMRSLFTRDAQNKNEWVDDWAKQAMKWLSAVSEREAVILDSTGAESPLASTGKLIMGTRGSYTPIFDVDTATAWSIDSDLIDSIDSDRS